MTIEELVVLNKQIQERVDSINAILRNAMRQKVHIDCYFRTVNYCDGECKQLEFSASVNLNNLE